LINKFNAPGSGYKLEHTFTQFVEITQCNGHYAVQGQVTDFSTNLKLIYDFLLVINTYLPPILHRLRVMIKFSLARASASLSRSR